MPRDAVRTLSPFAPRKRVLSRSERRLSLAIVSITAVLAIAVLAGADATVNSQRVDPAAWGDDHVGRPPPAYVTGDECLFCHRETGATWGDNRHQLSMRSLDADEPAAAQLRELGEIADDTRFLMGDRRLIRFLRRSNEYGKLDVLSASFVPETNQWKDRAALAWDKNLFADRCAGCHTTAVDPQTRAFSAVSLDCFTCHGEVDLAHTKDKRLVLLSDGNRASREVVSICGQCHLRGGKSKSSGRPYPNTFVAGDNLFRDFRVDLSDAAIEVLPQFDQHIYLNARAVVVFDQPGTTCLTCHDVHGQSSEKHQHLASTAICTSCHVPGTNNSRVHDTLLPRNRLRTHSRVCDY